MSHRLSSSPILWVLLAWHLCLSESRTLRTKRESTDISGGTFLGNVQGAEAVGIDDTASSLQFNDNGLQVASKDDTTIESPVAISLEEQDALQTSEQQVWTREPGETVEASEPLPYRALRKQAARSSAVPQPQDQVYLLQAAEREALLKQQDALQASEQEQDSLVAREKDLEVRLAQARQQDNELALAQARSAAGRAPDAKAPSANVPNIELDEDKMSTEIKVAICIGTAFVTVFILFSVYYSAERFSNLLERGANRTEEQKEELYIKSGNDAKAKFGDWPASLLPDWPAREPPPPPSEQGNQQRNNELAAIAKETNSTVNRMHAQILANEHDLEHAGRGSFGSLLIDTLLKIVMCVLAITGAILKGVSAQFQPAHKGHKMMWHATKEQDLIAALANLTAPFNPSDYLGDDEEWMNKDDGLKFVFGEYLKRSRDAKNSAPDKIKKGKTGEKGKE